MTRTRVPPVLVTGATGRVGRVVVDRPVDAGVPVRALAHRHAPGQELGSGTMAMENVNETRYVQAEGQRRLVQCFDPVTEDVVASWPGDLTGGTDRRLLHRREYEPDPPEGFPWPTDGSPCVMLSVTA
jgi:hypothetical protein